MALYVIIIFAVVALFLNMFSCGGSPRTLRRIFFGTYFAEDGVTSESDVPNSRRALQNCIDNGLGIKVNVHSTEDRRRVISTYDDLSKEYGVDKRISECEYDDLVEMGLLSVQELIEMAGDKAPLLLQLVPGDHNESLCRYTADAIKASGRSNIAVTSFHTGIIKWFKDKEKKIFRGLTSAPAKDFVALSGFERFMTGNLCYNSVARPQFVMYRNKPQSALVKLVFSMGAIKGVWTVTNKAEAKSMENDKDMIVIRGFMPENPQFKILPERVKSQVEIKQERKAEEKAARRKARREYDLQRDREKHGINKAFLEAAEDFTEEIEEFIDDVKEEIAEIKEEIRD